MRRPVLVSSLSVGRCFAVDVPPGGSEEPSGSEVKRTSSVLAPEAAWKVVDVDGDDVVAESATGERRTFAAATKVVEVARQGYDQLVGRRAP